LWKGRFSVGEETKNIVTSGVIRTQRKLKGLVKRR